jgi:hypothetical protein
LGPEEAAVARGGGWTPTGAPHLRRLVVKILARWARAGFEPDEALRWHLGMFTPAEASGWRDAGFDLKDAWEHRTRGRQPETARRLLEASQSEQDES